jgi:hypothetical protein
MSLERGIVVSVAKYAIALGAIDELSPLIAIMKQVNVTESK